MDAAAAAIKGLWFPVKGSVKGLPEVLTPDETVQALAVAHHDGVMGVLALTDRRMLFRAQGWAGQRLVSRVADGGRLSARSSARRSRVGGEGGYLARGVRLRGRGPRRAANRLSGGSTGCCGGIFSSYPVF
ncbi:hypothetical protein [Streptomyces macrosporus]|uniref:hypothetical protein n=1 Tax=Streptomyces macrosporus TaxID=44032 RepID=UPI0031E115F2